MSFPRSFRLRFLEDSCESDSKSESSKDHDLRGPRGYTGRQGLPGPQGRGVVENDFSFYSLFMENLTEEMKPFLPVTIYSSTDTKRLVSVQANKIDGAVHLHLECRDKAAMIYVLHGKIGVTSKTNLVVVPEHTGEYFQINIRWY